jgi:hypothetical protein
MADKITEQEFFKSLERLEGLAKGQICTGPNSEKTSWAGTSKQSVPQTGEGVGADEDGDYDKGKARKSIAEKVMKGQPLDEREVALLNSDLAKSQDDDEDDKGGKDRDPREDEKEREDEEKKDEKGGGTSLAGMFGKSQDMGKSFAESVQESDTLQKGIEVSDFLLEMTKSFALGLENIKREVIAHVNATLGQFASEQGDFNKSLAEAVANIGYGVGALSKGIEDRSNQPASGPKSQLRAVAGGQGVQPLQKGQGNPLEGVTKAQVLDRMTDMLEKGQCSPLDVVKFETTGDLNPAIRDQITKSFSGQS